MAAYKLAKYFPEIAIFNIEGKKRVQGTASAVPFSFEGRFSQFRSSARGSHPISGQRKNMSNIFKKLGIGVSNFGKRVATVVKDTINVAVKVETILKAEQPLEKPFVFGLSAVISDVEALIAASETAITSNGLNFRADSQVYKEFVTLIADFKQLTPVVEQAVSILEVQLRSCSIRPLQRPYHAMY
jgi:hypothetical protein